VLVSLGERRGSDQWDFTTSESQINQTIENGVTCSGNSKKQDGNKRKIYQHTLMLKGATGGKKWIGLFPAEGPFDFSTRLRGTMAERDGGETKNMHENRLFLFDSTQRKKK